MDDGSDSSIWHKLSRLFHPRHADSVEQLIREASEEGELDKQEGSMLLSVLALDELQVRDIMTPRTDIECVSETADVREVAECIIGTGHSRIPVYSGNRDNIIGILHAKDLLEQLLDATDLSRPASTFMRDTFFVPETKNVRDLLQEFRTRKNHLAVILDEYGGTAGLVSIEDVIEVIVGDIEDEHDAPREQEISYQDDGSYLITGRAYLEDISEALPVNITSEEVDTLGGYLTHMAGRVPEKGERFDVDGAEFVVEEADAKQIHSVRMILPRQDSQSDNAQSDNAGEEMTPAPGADGEDAASTASHEGETRVADQAESGAASGVHAKFADFQRSAASGEANTPPGAAQENGESSPQRLAGT